MLSARTVLILVLVFAGIALLAQGLELVDPSDPPATSADTYGTWDNGYRAVFETLDALGIPQLRSADPPGFGMDPSGTRVVWDPQNDVLREEPVFLANFVDWVRAGGRLVVSASDLLLEDESLWKPLGLESLALERVDVLNPTVQPELPALPAEEEEDAEDDAMATTLPRSALFAAAPDESTPEGAVSAGRELARKRRRRNDDDGPQSWRHHQEPSFPVDVRVEGDFGPLAGDINQLVLRQTPYRLSPGTTRPIGRIEGQFKEKSYLLAARYAVGRGEVIVVSDPRLLANESLDKADNSVLAVALLGVGTGPVVWDEFYHGLTMRGNFLFLLRRGQYALLAAMVVLATAGWIWRQARFLGPPLEPVPVSRRNLREYVEAMAQLFGRASGSRPFVLAEVRQGVLWSLRQRLGGRHAAEAEPVATAGPGRAALAQRQAVVHDQAVDEIAAVLARRDPAAAKKLKAAVERADQLLAAGSGAGKQETLQAVKELSDCL